MNLVDLFAGCGGMTLGFRRAGFRSVLAVENDHAAASTYAANFGSRHVAWCGIEDVGDRQMSGLPEVDVVIGGPPCQGFSGLGSRDPGDPRNRLWREYLRFVAELRPRMFVIENVDRFLRSNEFALLQDALTDGALPGYRIVSGVLNAADFGAPQKRHRAIVIGSRVGEPQLPGPTHSRTAAAGLRPWRTVRDVLAALPARPNGVDLPPDHMDTFFDIAVPGPFKGLDIHVGRRPTEMSLRRYRHIPEGGNRFALPEELLSPCWQKKRTGTTDVMGRLHWDQPSVTIRTEFFKPEKGRYLHPSENRPITHYEAAKLQGFPESFGWCGTKVQIARQIGNAVPVQLARAVAKAVERQLSS